MGAARPFENGLSRSRSGGAVVVVRRGERCRRAVAELISVICGEVRLHESTYATTQHRLWTELVSKTDSGLEILILQVGQRTIGTVEPRILNSASGLEGRSVAPVLAQECDA